MRSLTNYIFIFALQIKNEDYNPEDRTTFFILRKNIE